MESLEWAKRIIDMEKIIKEPAMLLKQADAVAIITGGEIGIDSGLELYMGTE